MGLNNSHNPEKELNNDSDVKYLKSLLTEAEKKKFIKVHKVFRELSKNGDLIFLSFILKISKPKNINSYNKFLGNNGFNKETLDNVIKSIEDNIDEVLNNKKENEEIEENELPVIKYLSEKYTLNEDEILDLLSDEDIEELNNGYSRPVHKKEKDLFLKKQGIFDFLDKVTDKDYIEANY